MYKIEFSKKLLPNGIWSALVMESKGELKKFIGHHCSIDEQKLINIIEMVYYGDAVEVDSCQDFIKVTFGEEKWVH